MTPPAAGADAAAAANAADTSSGDARTQQLLRKFTLLDAAFGFLSKHRAVLSLRNVVNMANSLGGAAAMALTVDDVREMARIAPALIALNVLKSHQLQHKDDVFRPTELAPLDREILAFPLAPQPSQRASAKRKQLFQAALLAQPQRQQEEVATSGDTTAGADPVIPLHTAPPPPASWATTVSSNANAPVAHWLRMLQSLPFYDQQLVHVERRAPRAAQLCALSDLHLPPQVHAALAARGIAQLYAHQFRAIAALRAGDNVVLSTATASGKSLAYNVPMLTSLLEAPDSTFLYLFPTKALAQDQLKSLRSFLTAAGLPPHLGNTFDGDTHMKGRTMVIRETQVFLTNPDMLHLSILPRHTQWKRVLAKLRLVVVDEAHMYRGVFGSHVACVFRRLFRLCALYGASPQVVCCSATIQNPRQHFELLVPMLPPRCVRSEHSEAASTTTTESPPEAASPTIDSAVDASPAHLDFFRARPLCVITEDGAPTGEKFICLWNPMAGTTSADASTPSATNAPQTTRPSAQTGTKRKRTNTQERALETVPEPSTASTSSDSDAPPPPASVVSTSSIFQSARIFARFMELGVHTLLFCRGRKLSELMLMTVHSVLRDTANGARSRELLRRVSTYRGGYTLADRRAIEQRLFSGDLLGVIATNALELGIDVGDLDCTMHLGLPKSVASLWQQAGRAGRNAAHQSIAVIVCFDAPLDQHFARHARSLFALEPEAVALNPRNARVVAQHLLCAARESPLYSPRSGTSYIDAFMFGRVSSGGGDGEEPAAANATTASADAFDTGVTDILATLVREQKLRQCTPGEGGGYRLHACMPRQFRAVSLRSIDEVVYQVVTDDAEQKVLDEIPGDMAFFQVYPTAVYLHQAHEYLITKVDNERKLAFAKKCAVPLTYFTACKDITQVDVVRVHTTHRIGQTRAPPAPTSPAAPNGTLRNDSTTYETLKDDGDHDHQELQLRLGVVSVLTRVYGATVIEKRSMRLLHSTEFSLPPMQTFGNALWLELPVALQRAVTAAGYNWSGALHGVGHLCVAVVSLFVLCEGADINTEHYNPLERRVRPNRVTIFERREGGSGIIEEIHRVLPQVVEKAWTIAHECTCTTGCPACIHSSDCAEFNKVLDKHGALLVLDFVHAAFRRERSAPAAAVSE